MLHMAIFNANNGKEPVIFRKNRPFFEFATNRSSMKTKNDLKKRKCFIQNSLSIIVSFQLM